jgi:hypothetical protein
MQDGTFRRLVPNQVSYFLVSADKAMRSHLARSRPCVVFMQLRNAGLSSSLWFAIRNYGARRRVCRLRMHECASEAPGNWRCTPLSEAVCAVQL